MNSETVDQIGLLVCVGAVTISGLAHSPWWVFLIQAGCAGFYALRLLARDL